MEDQNPLFERFPALISWMLEEFLKAHMTMALLEKDLPAYHRALREQIKAMEAAYFKGDLEGMKKAEENIKKFTARAAERVPKPEAA